MTISNYELADQAQQFGVELFLENILLEDQLARVPVQPFLNVVINSVSSGSRDGKHWTLLMIRQKFAMHFDSYAGVPTRSVIDYCRKYNLTLCHNKFIVQSMTSSQCGRFCLAMLVYEKYEKNTRVPPACWGNRLYELANSYVNLFDADTNRNDTILDRYLQQMQRR